MRASVLASAREGDILICYHLLVYILILNYAWCCDLAVSYYTKSTDFKQSEYIYMLLT